MRSTLLKKTRMSYHFELRAQNYREFAHSMPNIKESSISYDALQIKFNY